jgi:hypothetical protein
VFGVEILNCSGAEPFNNVIKELKEVESVLG